MRQHTPKWIAACAGMLLTVSCIGGLSASATTVDDVIAHAYAVGLPDETIQQCINQYSSGQYTSEQCDAAIAELDAWAADRCRNRCTQYAVFFHDNHHCICQYDSRAEARLCQRHDAAGAKGIFGEHVQ